MNDDEPQRHWLTPSGVDPGFWYYRLNAAATSIQSAARRRRAVKMFINDPRRTRENRDKVEVDSRDDRELVAIFDRRRGENERHDPHLAT